MGHSRKQHTPPKYDCGSWDRPGPLHSRALSKFSLDASPNAELFQSRAGPCPLENFVTIRLELFQLSSRVGELFLESVAMKTVPARPGIGIRANCSSL